MLMVARQEPLNLPLFMFQTVQTEAKSTTSYALPHRLMLTWFMIDAGVQLRADEPTIKLLEPIDTVTTRRSFGHAGRR